MSENLGEFERLLGHAALRLWSELPREVQEKLFETAVPLDPVIRNRLAIFLHDRHPRTAHPPRPTELAWLFWQMARPRSPPSPRAAYGMGGCF
jgi:hypothetical protein